MTRAAVRDRNQQTLVQKIESRLSKESMACEVSIVDDPIEGPKSMILIFAKKNGVSFNILIPWKIADWCHGTAAQIVRKHLKSKGGACHVSIIKKDENPDIVRIDILRDAEHQCITMPWSLMTGQYALANEIIRSNWI